MANNDYDALVIGAGVGGLTVASLLAHEGWKTLLIEQADRVGGRAMTLSGDEIIERGENWYRSALGSQYTWLAACTPGFDEIVRKRLTCGYQLDIGYHGVSLNGRGYFYDLEQIIGPGDQEAVEFVGNVNATYVDDEWYLDFHAGKMDPRIKAMVKETGLPFLDFFLAPLSMHDADYERWERVSVGQWLRDTGIAQHRVLSKMIHAVATLITTINDPDEISIGDIWRYMGQVLNPRFSKGIAQWPSGFVKGGIGRWMESVARRFLQKGGTLLLDARMTHIHVTSNKVQGIRIKKQGEEQDLNAPIVVSAIPIQDTFRYIDPTPFPQEWVNRARSLRGYGAIAPYFGLRDLVLPDEQWDKGTKDTGVIPRDNGLSH
ncbi:MAG: phytoene desaturase family protein, partial [Desulfomonilaceae bacterium]